MNNFKLAFKKTTKDIFNKNTRLFIKCFFVFTGSLLFVTGLTMIPIFCFLIWFKQFHSSIQPFLAFFSIGIDAIFCFAYCMQLTRNYSLVLEGFLVNKDFEENEK